MIQLDVLSATDVAVDDDAAAAAAQPATWRSRADRDDAPGQAALRRREFQSPPAGTGGEPGGDDRRTFLKVMGASVALAGLSGCRRPEERILPYARKPEEVIPGVPNHYATAMPLGGVAYPVLVESHEGRPTNVEGNPEHPFSQGATTLFEQASVLNLYDPDRSRHVWNVGESGPERADWNAFLGIASRLQGQAAGARLAILAAPTASPTEAALREQLLAAYPAAALVELGPHGDDYQAIGTTEAFGQPARPLHAFSQADIIVSLDGDFLGPTDPASVWNMREYAQSRAVDTPRGAGRPRMSRLYVAESEMTTTGGMADHRYRLKAGAVPFFAAALAARLGVDTGASTAAMSQALQGVSFGDGASINDVTEAIAADVRASGGRAVFVTGPTQPPQVHALCAALNGRFGGAAARYVATGAPAAQPVGDRLAALVRQMRAGQVDALLCLGTNPVYSLPADLGFAEAMARVPLRIHHGLHRDETAVRSTWHLPATHYLEAWDAVRAYDGTLAVQQPLIAPLYPDCHSALEVLAALAGQPADGYALTRATLRDALGGESAWRTALHDGFVPNTAFPAVGAGGGAPSLAGLQVPQADDVELVFRLSPTLFDGTFSTNAWMLETPHPVSKVTWDGTATLSPRTAARLGVAVDEEGGKARASTVRLTTANGSAELPVWVQPGHPDNSISVPLGWGRALETDRPIAELGLFESLGKALRPGDGVTNVYREGPLANGLGANVAPLRSFAQTAVLPGVAVEPGELSDVLVATTQDHGSMEGRAIARFGALADYLSEPDFAQDAVPLVEDTPWEQYPPLWGEENSASDDPRVGDVMYADQQWGMTIDLNACTGCNACVTACQSENNVPVVGKDQVARGREMHWMRLDRYYVGENEDEPGMVTMPMLCVHCENAPCEQVCPVNATVHSPDGINAMVYNRCIGTRYCANNCPYKVRRYNFYNWTKDLPLETQMAANPYVTVRYRGVMEKCTFCVQRVRRTQQVAHIENRGLTDGEVQTACQTACPANAIVFGDLRDATSAVSRSKQNPRNYAVLAELAVKPRVTYLARLTNPNPALPAPPLALRPANPHGDGQAHGEPALAPAAPSVNA